MPIKLNAPDYEDFAVTSPTASWLPASRWDATDHKTFVELRSAAMSSMDKAPKLRRDTKRPQPFLAAQWLLKSQEDVVLGWAELQSFPRKHDNYGIVFVAIPNLSEDEARAEFAYLMTFTFLLGKFDHLRIIPASGSRRLVERVKEWVGEEKSIMVLPSRAWIAQGNLSLSMPVLDVSRFDWISLKSSQPSLRSLQHVQVRMERYSRTGAKKQKRRGLLARLFRPRIDDSLF